MALIQALARRLSRTLFLTAAVVIAAALLVTPARAAEKTSFKVAWSIYVGWMPWDYAGQSGILKKWADKYGITIELTQINDYVESINQYTAGKYDACVMTNMDMLTIPSAGGVDSTVLIVGDYSNGNDGVVLKGAGKKLGDIKGQPVNLVELSVSHYLLARGLASVGLAERDIKVVNTSDADIVGAFASPGVTATVTWKPQLAEVVAVPKTSLVFDSSKIPGEILDLMVVNSQVLKDNPKLGKALVGAWYETLALMQAKDAKATAALESMAKASGTDLAGFKGQLATTYLYATPASAVAATKAPDLLKKMDLVRTFSFEHGLLGEGAKTVDVVGIAFPGGATLGDKANIKMRFDASYMQLAAEGKLYTHAAATVRRLINQHPGRGASLVLGALPFIALLVLYVVASHLRLAENPNDKLLPALGAIAETFHSYAFEEDRRSGQVLFWVDTWASLKRIGAALAISATLGMLLAVAIGVVPRVRAFLSPLLGTIAMIPPLAVLPVLFIVLGLEETAKIALIVIGIAPCIARDLALRVGELPREQLIKAQTLGASTWQLIVRVVLPQLWPRLIDSLRLSMGSAWLFLIAAEAIASTEGLGYRIFLVRRYLAMDVILPYVVWITLLAVLADFGLRVLRQRAFRWAEPER